MAYVDVKDENTECMHKSLPNQIHRQKGFTLAELLITVAIIAVLVAIAVPIFRNQLEKSREAYDIYTMRQAASIAVDYMYQGDVNKDTASAIGLKWWDNGGKGDNAAGVYNPGSGTFSPIGSKEAKKGYGKGTKVDSGATYNYFNREIYRPQEDYTNAVILVSIYPNDHVDVYWKNVKDGKYIGGQGKNGANDPKYSIRIYYE